MPGEKWIQHNPKEQGVSSPVADADETENIQEEGDESANTDGRNSRFKFIELDRKKEG